MSASPSPADLRKGMRVRLTFEGEIVSDVKAFGPMSVWLKPETTGPVRTVSWSKNHHPDIEILDPGFQDGDVGVWTGHSTGQKINVVFRQFNQNGSESWYNVRNGEFVCVARASGIERILHADGTLVEGHGL